ncbi:VRR-NUC domain-containing protein [Cobetia sp. 29-18-1]|uniref:VRR-NUC domain-containing protein n=1 Tax=Cobetia sp. 29-18-1 TaxID=3040018 RepID=UPI00244BBEEB|nr:VRR-NUC domain-containing protein [Cobetia sp. 29-18-1]MDH2299812.1 VRR-NUC domain-containing protein [Cobetia sp. 29-18-1]
MIATARPAPRKVTKRPATGRRIDREGHEQMVLIRWLNGEQRRGKQVGVLLEDVTYHVPNGGQRNKKTAADLKAQGVRAGVSDLVIASARGGWHGLYLEFKAAPPHDAALAGSQREWLARMEARGYLAVLAKGVEEAKAVLIAYADWPATQVVGCPESMPHGSAWRRIAAE